jgi:hypothetical protein
MNRQREIAKTWGFIVFKTVARFFLITAAFMETDQAAGRVCVILLIAIDLALKTNMTFVEASAIEISDKMWFYTLTNRIFYRGFFEKVRSGEHLDVDYLFQEASKSAVEDIKQARDDETLEMELGGLKKFGVAAWSFALTIVGYATEYGVPFIVASLLKH